MSSNNLWGQKSEEPCPCSFCFKMNKTNTLKHHISKCQANFDILIDVCPFETPRFSPMPGWNHSQSLCDKYLVSKSKKTHSQNCFILKNPSRLDLDVGCWSSSTLLIDSSYEPHETYLSESSFLIAQKKVPNTNKHFFFSLPFCQINHD